MAMYVASLSLGFALGPFILSWLGNASSAAFFVGSLITMLAGLSLIGWLADRMDRRRLIIVFSALSAVGALIWPLALTDRWLSYGLLFVWGGVFVGIYTVVVTQVGER